MPSSPWIYEETEKERGRQRGREGRSSAAAAESRPREREDTCLWRIWPRGAWDLCSGRPLSVVTEGREGKPLGVHSALHLRLERAPPCPSAPHERHLACRERERAVWMRELERQRGSAGRRRWSLQGERWRYARGEERWCAAVGEGERRLWCEVQTLSGTYIHEHNNGLLWVNGLGLIYGGGRLINACLR